MNLILSCRLKLLQNTIYLLMRKAWTTKNCLHRRILHNLLPPILHQKGTRLQNMAHMGSLLMMPMHPNYSNLVQALPRLNHLNHHEDCSKMMMQHPVQLVTPTAARGAKHNRPVRTHVVHAPPLPRAPSAIAFVPLQNDLAAIVILDAVENATTPSPYTTV